YLAARSWQRTGRRHHHLCCGIDSCNRISSLPASGAQRRDGVLTIADNDAARVLHHAHELSVRPSVSHLTGSVARIERGGAETFVAGFPIADVGMVRQVGNAIDVLSDILHPGTPDQVGSRTVGIDIGRQIALAVRVRSLSGVVTGSISLIRGSPVRNSPKGIEDVVD